MKERPLGLTFAVAFAILLTVFVTGDLGRHLIEILQMTAEDARLDQEIAHAEEQNQRLQTLKSEVQTPNWIERFVRIKWHWSRANEPVVVPIATAVPTPSPVPTVPAYTPPPKQFWEEWLDTLFGPPQ